MTDDELVQEFWGETSQGAKLCTWADLVEFARRVREDERGVVYRAIEYTRQDSLGCTGVSDAED